MAYYYLDYLHNFQCNKLIYPNVPKREKYPEQSRSIWFPAIIANKKSDNPGFFRFLSWIFGYFSIYVCTSTLLGKMATA